MKKCSKCKISQELTSFHLKLGGREGLRSICKTCVKSYNSSEKHKVIKQKYVQSEKGKVAVKTYNKKYCQSDVYKTKIKSDKYKIYQKEYRTSEKNIAKRRIYLKNRFATNINFKLSHCLRRRNNNAIKNNQKSGSAVKDLGCTIAELKFHLESKFHPGMTWDNWGNNGWHIDHIVPLSSFDLTDREQFLKACHYSNTQPLWAIDNMKKGNR